MDLCFVNPKTLLPNEVAFASHTCIFSKASHYDREVFLLLCFGNPSIFSEVAFSSFHLSIGNYLRIKKSQRISFIWEAFCTLKTASLKFYYLAVCFHSDFVSLRMNHKEQSYTSFSISVRVVIEHV